MYLPQAIVTIYQYIYSIYIDLDLHYFKTNSEAPCVLNPGVYLL